MVYGSGTIIGVKRNFFLKFESSEVRAARKTAGPIDFGGRMYRSNFQGTSRRSLHRTVATAAAVLAGLLGWSSMAAAQAKTMPDAQVEANILKALAGAPDLANQAISTTTVYGVVTLSGSVATEALRTEAETIASKTVGVQKVIDELVLGTQGGSRPVGGSSISDAQGTNPTLQSDGTMAPSQGSATGAQGSPDSDNTGAPNQAGNMQGAPGQPGTGSGPYYGPGAPEYPQSNGGQQVPQPGYPQANGQPQQPGYPQPGYPQTNGQQQPGYPQQGYGPPPQGYPPQPAYNGAPQVYGGQQSGEVVTVPNGAMVRIRINQTLDSARSKPGDHFDGIVVNDVVAGGAVAIPRGASVQGTVVDAKKSGVLAGRGELSLQLTQVTLGGKSYPIVSDMWAHNGGDKTIQTVNSTAVGGGVGALVGAAAGGGEGAAIGAGIGAALGLGSSAASHSGQVFVPSEGLLTFHLAQPATVATVSQQEMDRLAQGVPGGGQQLQRRYPAPYYGPAYPRPYYPYPY